MTEYFSKNTSVVTGMCMCFLLIALSSCDKEPAPTGPSDENLARCAHVIDNGFLHQVCLNNPWPDELPPATQEGLSTFGCWINDTLAFVAYDPRESMRFNVRCSRRSSDGLISLEGQRTTYEDIDPSFFGFSLVFDESGSVLSSGFQSSFWITSPELSGRYYVDPVNSIVEFDTSDGYGYGTFSLTLTDSTTNKTISLTDGRFHAPFGG